MMDEFEHRDGQEKAPVQGEASDYDTGDGYTDNLKQKQAQAEPRTATYTGGAAQEPGFGTNYYGDMRTQEYMQAMAARAQQISQGNTQYYSQNYQQTQTPYRQNGQNRYNSGFSASEATEQTPKQKIKKAKKQKVKKTKTPHTKRTFWKKATAVVVSAAVFGGVAGGVMYGIAGNQIKALQKLTNATTEAAVSETPATTESLSLTSTTSVGNGMDVSAIAENVMPSVVAIHISAIVEQQGFFGYTQQYEAEGSGSGIIIGENDSELLMVTNNHVVSDATTVNVTFVDGESYEAKVKSTDSDTDLAIVVVDLSDISESTMSQIKIATIGDSDSLKVGEQVVAIGNALGYGQSVTTGIVSAKDRTNSTNTTPLIQTDAAINPGNSGGALLNMSGEVIGINSSKYSDTTVEGMGYAIPITAVEERLDDMMNRETREKVDEEKRGYLGISCATVSSDVSEMYGIPTGVLVSEVQRGSAAMKAGIKANYVITKVDGQSISSAEELTEKLSYYAAGEEVPISFEYLKDDSYVEKTVTVTLMEKSSIK